MEVSMGQHDTGVHSSASDSQWVLIKENHSYQISKYYPVMLLQSWHVHGMRKIKKEQGEGDNMTVSFNISKGKGR